MPKKITAKWLKEQGACASELRVFKRVFPLGASWPPTQSVLAKACAAGLNVGWVMMKDDQKSNEDENEAFCSFYGLAGWGEIPYEERCYAAAAFALGL